jgi:hypothetical protein
MKNALLLLLFIVGLASCTIEKRRYFKGYHVALRQAQGPPIRQAQGPPIRQAQGPPIRQAQGPGKRERGEVEKRESAQERQSEAKRSGATRSGAKRSEQREQREQQRKAPEGRNRNRRNRNKIARIRHHSQCAIDKPIHRPSSESQKKPRPRRTRSHISNWDNYIGPDRWAFAFYFYRQRRLRHHWQPYSRACISSGNLSFTPRGILCTASFHH